MLKRASFSGGALASPLTTWLAWLEASTRCRKDASTESLGLPTVCHCWVGKTQSNKKMFQSLWILRIKSPISPIFQPKKTHLRFMRPWCLENDPSKWWRKSHDNRTTVTGAAWLFSSLCCDLEIQRSMKKTRGKIEVMPFYTPWKLTWQWEKKTTNWRCISY